MGSIITFVTLVAGFITVIGGIVTIVWFIKDSRKENSKVLKKIEEGQREGFKTLAMILENSLKILERVKANTQQTMTND